VVEKLSEKDVYLKFIKHKLKDKFNQGKALAKWSKYDNDAKQAFMLRKVVKEVLLENKLEEDIEAIKFVLGLP